MSKKNARELTGPSITQPLGSTYTLQLGDGSKVSVTPDQLTEVFRKTIAGINVPVTHADPSTFKTNPVAPGIGPRVIASDVWLKRQINSAVAAATDWEERTLTPRKDPIQAAIAANQKRKDRLAQAEKDEKWLKTMNKRNFNDVIEGVQAVGVSGYSDGVTKKKAKAERRIKELQPLAEAVAKTLDAMPTGTKAERGAKMLAARDLMLEVGNKMRGIQPT